MSVTLFNTPDSGCCAFLVAGRPKGAARLVRPEITVIICPKYKHFVLYSNNYLGVLNNYK